MLNLGELRSEDTLRYLGRLQATSSAAAVDHENQQFFIAANEE